MKTESLPLKRFNDLKPLIDKWKDKRIVMLGESSHGTQEFYRWRRKISNYLIQEHDFDFIAVEGDWPSCERINRFVKAEEGEDAIHAMRSFTRWPTWMWANTEVMRLMDDLRDWNVHSENSVGFHGLDVYSMYESMDEVVSLLQELDPKLGERTRQLYSCFEPHRHDERSYVRSLFHLPEGCQEQVQSVLKSLLESHLMESDRGFDAIQNATIVKNAERYYQTMISQEDDSWNIRDAHMMETLDTLLNRYGPNSKGIVWAHNTHIGDYRATDMVLHKQVNLGGLAREKYGEDQITLVGFTTYQGSVMAAPEWDGPMQAMTLPEGRTGSLELLLHQAVPEVGSSDFALDFSTSQEDSIFHEYIGHRAIGVVYHPEHEHRGNYVPTIPAKRYDALVFLDATHALTPLNIKFEPIKVPETFPFGDRV